MENCGATLVYLRELIESNRRTLTALHVQLALRGGENANGKVCVISSELCAALVECNALTSVKVC
jgi:hypothetical protein